MELDYEYFKREVYKITQIDLNAYKEKQMKRRIDTLILRHHLTGYESFVSCLKNDKEVLEEFVNYLTINVSEFYRNPDQWRILEKDIIPLLSERFGSGIKIWSAACSTGDEPYTLAMVFSDKPGRSDFSIYATDIDKQVLDQAKSGIYPKKALSDLPKEYKDKYFSTENDATFKVDPSLRKYIRFEKHNLLLDPFPKNQHLIVCRNVLIYFTEEAKEAIFEKFYDSLAPGGVLFLGSTEQMINYKKIGYERKASFFFEKPL
ncbi:MAG: protein-glutamate O-methyltransferase CheR [Lachnospiraceae bacterium]|nr:protein-glutamate O-methyltransferase CheR [Lachnospiraceae bacterium]